MKLTKLITGLILIATSVINAQTFTWQHPSPQGNDLQSVKCIGTSCWAAGRAGTIIKSSDGGTTWSVQNPTRYDLYDIYFSDVNTGYVVGDSSTIFKTTDGGATWNQQTISTNHTLQSVFFIDANTGYIAGGNPGVILKTTNGGNNWDTIYSNSSYYLKDIMFLDANTGFVAAGGDVLKTTDGGTTWSKLTIGSWTGLESVYFTDVNTGYVVSWNSYLTKTIDGGVTWTQITLPVFTNLFEVYFTDNNTGYIVGGFPGTVFKTSDAGTNWSSINIGSYPYQKPVSISFTDVNTAIAVGDAGLIIKTTNAGSSWNWLSIPYRAHLFDIDFLDQSKGLAAGGDIYTYIIYKTNDAGTTWDTIIPPAPSGPINSINYPAPNIAYAVGTIGYIIKTTDGGSTWNKQVSPSDGNLFDVFFIGSDTGYIAGNPSGQQGNNAILKTTDGGSTWIAQVCSTYNGMNALYFIDANTGWAAGCGSSIFKTTNGGATWVKQQENINSLCLTDIFFVDANTGYAVGDGGMSSGICFKTTNGGANWTSIYNQSSSAFKDVFFTDANTGYIVGGTNIVATSLFKTTDGGTTWAKIYGVQQTLYGIDFVNSTTAYLSGSYGAILKYSDTPSGIYFEDTRNDVLSEISIYPNPFNTSATITIHDDSFTKGELIIYDVLGNVVRQISITDSTIEIQKENINSGVYLFELRNEKEIISHGKFVVQ